MKNPSNRFNGMSRRGFLKTSGSVGAASLLGSMGIAGMARAQSSDLTMWWWGQQELPGLQSVVDDAVASCPSSYKMGHQSGLSFGGSGSFV